MAQILIKIFVLKGFEGGPPILLKEEPEDGPRSMQKVPSLSDLSDPEASLGEYIDLINPISVYFE